MGRLPLEATVASPGPGGKSLISEKITGLQTEQEGVEAELQAKIGGLQTEKNKHWEAEKTRPQAQLDSVGKQRGTIEEQKAGTEDAHKTLREEQTQLAAAQKKPAEDERNLAIEQSQVEKA